MKRSEINANIRRAKGLFASLNFRLPFSREPTAIAWVFALAGRPR